MLSPTHGARPEGQLAAVQRRSVPLYNIDLASLGYLVVARSALLGDYRATAALQHRVDERDDRRAASPRSARSRAASTTAARSRSTTCSSRHRSRRRGRAHDEVRLRLAAACGRRRPIWAGEAARTPSTARIPARRARPPAQYGQGIASFMLGLPNTTSLHRASSRTTTRPSSATVLRARRLARERRLTLNLGVRYDLELGMTESDDRNIGAFDSDDGESDPGAGAGATSPPVRRRACRGRPASSRVLRRVHVSVWRSVARMERGLEQLPASRGLHVQDRRPDRPAWRHRQIHRALPAAGRAGAHHRDQSDRVLAQHAGPRDERQGLDVPGQPEQSGSERPARTAGGIVTGSRDQSRETRQATSGTPTA